LRKTGEGLWEGERVAMRLRRNMLGMWEANKSGEMDDIMDPMNDVPEFDDSFRKLIRPCVRKSRRQRMNIPEDAPTPPPTSSDDDCFEPIKRVKKKVLRRKK
jgi:hypothetical protein